jgi:3-deoxy-D-manno-octulosonic-acid transferase
VDEKKIAVTGSIKFDGVQGDRNHPKVNELRSLFGLDRLPRPEVHRKACVGSAITQNLTWIVGSTQEPEEKWALDIHQEARKEYPELRLILVPRHPERFDAVAQMLQTAGANFARRSQLSVPHDTSLSTRHIILMDTLGELSHLWGLADLAFVGGSFNDRGGQNMIEPAAYGVSVMFGPNVWNFQQIADSLLREQAAIQVKTKSQWQEETMRLLADGDERMKFGSRAKEFVARQQGATRKTVEIVKQILAPHPSSRQQAA